MEGSEGGVEMEVNAKASPELNQFPESVRGWVSYLEQLGTIGKGGLANPNEDISPTGESINESNRDPSSAEYHQRGHQEAEEVLRILESNLLQKYSSGQQPENQLGIDQQRNDEIQRRIRESGEIVGLLPGVGAIDIQEKMQGLLFNREKGGFSPFNDYELANIGQLLQNLGLTPDKANEMSDLITARVVLQSIVASWNNAMTARNIVNDAEYKKQMSNFRLQTEIVWSTGLRDSILKVPGVEEALVDIQNTPNFFKKVKKYPPGSSGIRGWWKSKWEDHPDRADAKRRFMDSYVIIPPLPGSPPGTPDIAPLGGLVNANVAWALAEKLMIASMGTGDALPALITLSHPRPDSPPGTPPPPPVVMKNAGDLGMIRLKNVPINLQDAQIEGAKQVGAAFGNIFEAFIKGLS